MRSRIRGAVAGSGRGRPARFGNALERRLQADRHAVAGKLDGRTEPGGLSVRIGHRIELIDAELLRTAEVRLDQDRWSDAKAP